MDTARVIVPSSKISVCVSSSGVLRLRSVRRLQPGLLHDSGPKQPAQLVEVHAPPSSSSFSSSSSLSSTLTNTGSQNPPSKSCQHSGKENINNNQPALWSSRQQWLHLSSGAAASPLWGGRLRCNRPSHAVVATEIHEVMTCTQNEIND